MYFVMLITICCFESQASNNAKAGIIDICLHLNIKIFSILLLNLQFLAFLIILS
uniref:BLTX394 n=1 Tax=Nephila pilipes TaxID=299642 RepID=A0A076KZH3_NEPPI|nr:BLTX394 [Nephila pilipes]